MIWNVFFVVFAILVLAAIVLTVWFLKLGKRIFLLIPLLLLERVYSPPRMVGLASKNAVAFCCSSEVRRRVYCTVPVSYSSVRV